MSNVTTITESLQKEIKAVRPQKVVTESGSIVQLFDGVAVVDGLPKAKNGEIVNFPHGITGMVIDLPERYTAVLVFKDYTELRVGDRVTLTGNVLRVPVSDKMLGRVVDARGEPVDGLAPIPTDLYEEVEKIAPGIIYRKSVNQPLQTGIKAIDSMIPIGQGQRELIIGDRATGKTTLIIDTILNQAKENVICVYVAIGQKESKIANVLNLLQERGAMDYTIIVSAPASSSAALQYIAPYAGTSIAEHFLKQGKNVLIAYDDLTKHAWAYRQLSLVLKRPAGREAYPGDVFYLHSRLLERACRIDPQYGGGSITALPVIETQEGDISAYIPTNVISITDGQIFLEKELFNAGMRPAINVGSSVSRVGSSAQVKAMKKVAGSLKMELAQYRELAAFSQFASDLDEQTKKVLNRGAHMYELLKQDKNNPMPVEEQVAIMWFGVNGYINEIPLANVSQFESEIITMLKAEKPKVLKQIREEKLVSENTEKDLHAFAKKFIQIFSNKS